MSDGIGKGCGKRLLTRSSPYRFVVSGNFSALPYVEYLL